MTHEMQEQDLTIRVPITMTMRAQAEAFASEQPTAEKAEQVFRNTLAVLVVEAYLKWQGYDTDLSEADSWQSTTRLTGDVADLMLAGLGRIECRPVRAGVDAYSLPPEVWHGRFGYVLVQLEEREAILLGFVPTFDPEDPLDELSLDELKSMDELMEYLERLRAGITQLENDASPDAAQVREMWEDSYSRLMLVAQLERIYRSEPRSKWRVKGEKVLSGRVLEGAVVREEAVPEDRIALQGVAERLLERLAMVWSNGNEG